MNISIINEFIPGLTAENQAAAQLKDMLTASVPEELEGEVYIASNVKHLYEFLWLIDIDIVVWGEFSNCILPHYYSLEEQGPKKDLVVKDFLVAIELKSHQADRVSCNDSEIWVKYSNKTQNVTHKINLQRKHLVDTLKSEHINVIASDAIWLNSVTKEELSKKTSGQNVNALPNEFEFIDLIDTILAQGVKPTYDEVNDCYVLSAGVDSSEIYSVMLFLMHLDNSNYDGAYYEEDEEEKQRKAEAEAKARNYFYNQKVRVARYCCDGYLDDYPDYSYSTNIDISDDDLAKIKQLVIADVRANEGSKESDLTFEEALKLVSFDEIYLRNEEIRSFLDYDRHVDFYDQNDISVTTSYQIPAAIGFDNPVYYYGFSYVVYNDDNSNDATPQRFDVMLTDEEYITLLTQQLLSYPYDYTFNKLLRSHPELAARINRSAWCDLPYVILFDEVKDDAKAINGPLPEEQFDGFPFSDTDPTPDPAQPPTLDAAPTPDSDTNPDDLPF